MFSSNQVGTKLRIRNDANNVGCNTSWIQFWWGGISFWLEGSRTPAADVTRYNFATVSGGDLVAVGWTEASGRICIFSLLRCEAGAGARAGSCLRVEIMIGQFLQCTLKKR